MIIFSGSLFTDFYYTMTVSYYVHKLLTEVMCICLTIQNSEQDIYELLMVLGPSYCVDTYYTMTVSMSCR